jgi:hypothetical protein
MTSCHKLTHGCHSGCPTLTLCFIYSFLENKKNGTAGTAEIQSADRRPVGLVPRPPPAWELGDFAVPAVPTGERLLKSMA